MDAIRLHYGKCRIQNVLLGLLGSQLKSCRANFNLSFQSSHVMLINGFLFLESTRKYL